MADDYGRLTLGLGDRPGEPVPPVDLSSFTPTGWYGTFATGRPWWQFWKPKVKFVSGRFDG